MAPSTEIPITRRRLLAAAGASATIAGCSSEGGDGDVVSTETGGTTGGDATDGEDDESGGESNGESDGESDGGDTSDGPLSDVPESVALEPVLQNLERPVALAAPAREYPWYVALQGGRIVGLDANDEPTGTVLDLTESVETAGNEQGLLGLALHPEFGQTRRAFVRYSAPATESTPEDYSHSFVLSEFEVDENGTFLPETERRLLEIPQPQQNHNAGDLVFGPEGSLYVPVGDGGAGGDQGTGHVDDWYEAVDGGNGQDVTENLLGSVLRIDVDGGDSYAVPDDNPLVGEPGFDEHYAWGFRNPWGVSFDGDDFYVADVGQARYEEVNLVEAGGNYGWNVREGTHCFDAEDCPDRTPEHVRGGEELIDPIVEYSHSGDGITGVSIIGGHVYRGDAIPVLEGIYVFGDLNAGNELFVATDGDGDGTWPMGSVATRGAGLQTLFAIEQGADDELYVLGGNDEGAGMVWRVVPDE